MGERSGVASARKPEKGEVRCDVIFFGKKKNNYFFPKVV